MAHSKTLAKIAKSNPDYIDDYYYEEGNGHFMHAKDGYVFPCMECGTCREDTVDEVLAVLRDGVQFGDYIDGITSLNPKGKVIKLRLN